MGEVRFDEGNFHSFPHAAHRFHRPFERAGTPGEAAPFFQLPIWFSISGGGFDLIKVVMRISHEGKTR
jgi:hypothetical protein